ncbi:MAG: hypothetical protein GXY01_02730 [Clostridiales bacterium]|nr:hypothetical protein [Clostridiales bacterium]
MTAEEIIARLEGDYLERLKWFVLREFRVLPTSKEAREMSDEDIIICGAHMILDKRMCFDTSGFEEGCNGCFDEERFALLSEEKI